MLQGFFLQYLGRPSLIAADDTWALLAVLCVSVAACLCLEGRYRWASKISGGILALLLGLCLNLTMWKALGSGQWGSLEHSESV